MNGEDPGADAAVIAAVLKGDTSRFRELVERYQARVSGYLYRQLPTEPEMVRDLAQTVFLKAYRNLASVDTARPLTPWLLRIAHNEAANHLRWRSRRPEAELEPQAWAQVPAAGGDDPESHAARQQEQALVRRALDALPHKMRSALMLFYFEERSYEEIAEVLNTAPGTVGTLIHRGRERMRHALESGPEGAPK